MFHYAIKCITFRKLHASFMHTLFYNYLTMYVEHEAMLKESCFQDWQKISNIFLGTLKWQSKIKLHKWKDRRGEEKLMGESGVHKKRK